MSKSFIPATYRKTARTIVVVLLLSHGMSSAAMASDTSTLLDIPGVQNDVTQLMNKSAEYASQQQLAVMNSLYAAPIKSRIQDMTCLDKIMAIKFIGLSSISFSAIIGSIINAVLMAILAAVCSVVDAAWDSAMGTLTAMTTINMGTAGSVSMVNANNNGVTVSPTYNSGSNPYLGAIGNSAIDNSGQATVYRVNPNYGGFNATPSNTNTSAWERTKNFFK